MFDYIPWYFLGTPCFPFDWFGICVNGYWKAHAEHRKQKWEWYAELNASEAHNALALEASIGIFDFTVDDVGLNFSHWWCWLVDLSYVIIDWIHSWAMIDTNFTPLF